MLTEWWSRLRYFMAGKKRAEVDEEIQFHLEREFEANVAAGMTAAEAKRRAAIAFGGRERAREQCRQERPSFFLEALGRDLQLRPARATAESGVHRCSGANAGAGNWGQRDHLQPDRSGVGAGSPGGESK